MSYVLNKQIIWQGICTVYFCVPSEEFFEELLRSDRTWTKQDQILFLDVWKDSEFSKIPSFYLKFCFGYDSLKSFTSVLFKTVSRSNILQKTSKYLVCTFGNRGFKRVSFPVPSLNKLCLKPAFEIVLSCTNAA